MVVGTTEEVESEGFDRESLALPGRQDELVRTSPRRTRTRSSSSTPVPRCCCRGPTASPPCSSRGSRARSSATRSRTYCSETPSPAAGCRRPGRARARSPVDPARRRRARYDEGLMIGYRGDERGERAPLYPFGHGLGYSTWEYESIDAPRGAGRRRRRGRCDRAQHRRAARPGGRPAVCEPCGQRRAATGSVAGRVCGRRRRRGRGRDRDDRCALAGVRALERRRGRLDDRAGHLRTRCGRLVARALAVFANRDLPGRYLGRPWVSAA